jgi:hypothetical protein
LKKWIHARIEARDRLDGKLWHRPPACVFVES